MIKLKHIEINIWKACNNKCRFCMSQESEPMKLKLVDFDYLKEKVITYAERWYNSVGFLGWDVSIYPKLEELMVVCNENWYSNVNIITNAMLFSNYDFLKRIVIAWATRVNISIHSHIDEVEDFLTQIPWWLQRKLQAIENMNRLRDEWLFRNPISINIVLNKQNYKDIVETCIFYYKMWIKDIRINFLRPNKDSEWYYDDILLTYTDALPYIKKLILLYLKTWIRVTFDSVPPCIFKLIDDKNYKNLIKIFLWEDYDYINAIDDFNVPESDKINFNFNWKEKKKNILKTPVKECEKCIYFDKCEWIRKEYIEIFWGDEFIWIKS